MAIDPIKSGEFTYTFDPHAMLLSFRLEAVVGKWLFTKKIDEAGSQVVGPHEMDSATYQKAGQRLQFGNVSGVITAVKDHVATVSITVDGLKAGGVATFSLAGKYVELLHLDADGSYGPFTFRIVAMQRG